MIRKAPFLLLAFFLMLFFSCTKEEEVSNPEITVNSPQPYTAYSMGDSIPVIAEIADAEGITSVKVVLVTEEVAIVNGEIARSFDGVQTKLEINWNYPLDNTQLESGLYYLQIQAKSNDGQKSQYIEVYISEMAVATEKAMVLSKKQDGNFHLGDISTDGNYMVRISDLGFKADRMAVNSQTQQLFLLSASPGRLRAYDAGDYQLQWIIEASQPYSVFTDIFIGPGNVYVSSENGELIGLNSAGNIQFTAEADQDYIPRQLAVGEDYVLTYAEKRNGPDRFVRVYYNGTGVYIHQREVEEKVIEIVPDENDLFYLFANKDNAGRIYACEAENNELILLKDVNQGMIETVVSATENSIYLKAGDYWFRYNTSLNSIMPASYLEQLEVAAYDEIQEAVYVSDGSTVEMITTGNGLTQWSLQVHPEVKAISVLYNK